jgi:glycerol-3-phosphate dehydrogenase subunit B
MEALLSLCSQENYSYVGSLQANQWIPTALGTLKPSCFTPLSMDTIGFEAAEDVYVVGFDGLKDYCVKIIADGLTHITKGRKKYSVMSLRTGMDDGRDLSALDVARWLDSEAGQKQFFEQLSRLVRPKGLILLPPVMGTRPDYEILKKTEEMTQCKVIETVGLPPAVTGFRLRRMLLNCLKKLNVQIIEQSAVIKANVTNGQCREIITGNPDRQRSYRANSFILATGGFFGGGLQANSSDVLETVFNLPVNVPLDRNRWGQQNLFSLSGQPFAKFGVRVDANLRPLDATGNVVLENVFIAGKTIAGYDYCLEKSGNGVALATAYRAGCEA